MSRRLDLTGKKFGKLTAVKKDCGAHMLGKLLQRFASKPPAYLRCFILMPGKHDISLPEIEGVSLKLVVREVMINHQGLKYWVAAHSAGVNLLSRDMEKLLGVRARADLLGLMFFKKPPKHDGFLIDSKGTIFEDGKKIGVIEMR